MSFVLEHLLVGDLTAREAKEIAHHLLLRKLACVMLEEPDDAVTLQVESQCVEVADVDDDRRILASNRRILECTKHGGRTCVHHYDGHVRWGG